MSIAKLLFKSIETELNKEMVYKWNFIIKVLSLVSVDIVSPLITLLIYRTTLGIPGWSFEQFILFQGTFIFVMGFNRLTQIAFAWKVIYEVREGTFDKFLIKPFNTLIYLSVTSWDLEGIGDLIVGILLLSWSFAKLGVHIISFNFLAYAFLVLVAMLFTYSIMVLISSLSFIVVKSFALFDIFFNLIETGRYPATIYNYGFRYFVSFFFPIAIASTFPATALLKGYSLLGVLELSAPVFIFFGISVLLWSFAMKKYSSAGG